MLPDVYTKATTSTVSNINAVVLFITFSFSVFCFFSIATVFTFLELSVALFSANHEQELVKINPTHVSAQTNLFIL